MQLISFRTTLPLEVEATEVPLRGSAPLLLPGGERAVLTAVPIGREQDGWEAITRLRRLAKARGQRLLRPLAAAVDGSRLLVVSEAPQGTSLRTVVRLVPLTWDQAALLGESLLAALASLHRLDIAHGGVSLDAAILGRDGGLRLADAALPERAGEPPSSLRSDLRLAAEPLSALFSDLTPATIRAVPEAAREQLERELERLRADGGQGSAEEALAAWRRAVRGRLDSDAKVRVGRQLRALAERLPGVVPAAPGLAALARGVDRGPARPTAAAAPASSLGSTQERAALESPALPVRPPAPTPALPQAAPPAGAANPVGLAEAVPAAAPPVTRPPAAAPRPVLPAPRRPTSDGPPDPPVPARPPLQPSNPWWNWRWLSAGVALLLLVVVGGGLLGAFHQAPRAPRGHGRVPSSSSRLSPSPSAVASPSPSPKAAPTPSLAPVLAPSSDPPVQQVSLVADCPSPGVSDCQYTVTANLGSHPPVTVSWEVAAVDRCTGSVTEMASGAVAAPGSYTYIEAQPEFAVPAGSPLWLVALAGAPGQAASIPVPVTPPSAACST